MSGQATDDKGYSTELSERRREEIKKFISDGKCDHASEVLHSANLKNLRKITEKKQTYYYDCRGQNELERICLKTIDDGQIDLLNKMLSSSVKYLHTTEKEIRDVICFDYLILTERHEQLHKILEDKQIPENSFPREWLEKEIERAYKESSDLKLKTVELLLKNISKDQRLNAVKTSMAVSNFFKTCNDKLMVIFKNCIGEEFKISKLRGAREFCLAILPDIISGRDVRIKFLCRHAKDGELYEMLTVNNVSHRIFGTAVMMPNNTDIRRHFLKAMSPREVKNLVKMNGGLDEVLSKMCFGEETAGIEEVKKYLQSEVASKEPLIARSSLSQKAIILLGYYTDTYIVPADQREAKKYAFIYYNAAGDDCADEIKRTEEGFRDADFTVPETRIDWTKDQLIEKVNEDMLEARDKCSLVIVCLTAHGFHDHVVDIDDKPIPIRDLSNIINEGIPQGIPKVFLIQSCSRLSPITLGPAAEHKPKRDFIRVMACGENQLAKRNQMIPGFVDQMNAEDMEESRQIIQAVGDVMKEGGHSDVTERDVNLPKNLYIGKPKKPDDSDSVPHTAKQMISEFDKMEITDSMEDCKEFT